MCLFFPSSATRTSSQVTFPVDFFEHNQQLTEVEFGGNDLLQVYNGQQIKHRLNSTGMYVANTKVSKMILATPLFRNDHQWVAKTFYLHFFNFESFMLVLANSLEVSRWK